MTDPHLALLQANVDELHGKLEEVISWCRRLDLAGVDRTERLDQLEGQVADITGTGGEPRGGQPGWQFDSVYDWVEEWFSLTMCRFEGGGMRWCPRWHEHPEALFRLTSLWRSWEEHRDDQKGGMIVWLRDLDSQLTALFNPDGAFRACSRTAHNLPPTLTCEAHA